ncbi:MAG: hypothetical protein AAF541_04160 [Pseudomonadota bacterium]
MLLSALAACCAFASNISAQTVSDPSVDTPQSPAALHTFTQAQLSRASDKQLTALAASWGQLEPGQRRLLLAEMRGRMSRSQRQGNLFASGSKAKMQRQYGRVIREVRKTRQADGSILVETRVVRVRPKDGANDPQNGVVTRKATFGIGFERRNRTIDLPEQVQPDASADVRHTASKPSP